MQSQTDSPEHADTSAPANIPLFFNPLQEGYFDNPYAHYAELREQDPVHQSLAGLPICFAYDDIRQVLIDGTTSMNISTVKELSDSVPGGTGRRCSPQERRSASTRPITPASDSLMMSRSFTPRKVHAFSDWITSEVDELLDDVGAAKWNESGIEPIDLIAEFAFPLPFKVISDIIGMPTQDHQQVRDSAQAISAATDPAAGPEKTAAAHAAYVALQRIRRPRRAPSEAREPLRRSAERSTSR